MGVDALAEKYEGYSGYNYVLGNPIGLVDPDGRSVEGSSDNNSLEICPTCSNTPEYDDLMIYNEFRIHSAVPIIVSKLITYDKFRGGTMAYSLKGLRLEGFTNEIRNLLDLEISFEMRCMIDRLDIKS